VGGVRMHECVYLEKDGMMKVVRANVIASVIALSGMALLVGCGKDSRDAKPVAEERTNGPLVLAVMPEIPPYAYVDTNSGETCGIDVDIVKATAERLGRPLEIRRVHFADLLSSVKDRKADFAAGAITITEGRRQNVEFSIPYAEEGAAFLYRSGELMPSMVRVEGLHVGVVESMTHDFYLTRHGIDPFRYGTIEDAIKALKARKVDTVFYDRPALAEVAKASGGELAVSPLETRENYGIVVRKDRIDYIEAVNAVIRERK
jgi:ABC-type amino acid transport substrate-binding protein